MTDGAGNFVLAALGAGTYRLTVEKNGYTPDRAAMRQPVELGPSRDAVALRLVPLGKIAGRVTDVDGDPVPGVSVRALHAVLEDGRRSFRQDRSVSTDDRGQYRLWNLQPGEYYIVAAGRAGGTVTYVGTASSGGVHEGFAPVYYPAARDRGSATPIVITPGQEVAADLKIAMQPAYRVRGTLRNISLRDPVKVELLRGASEVGSNRVLVNAATGRFEATDVVPGSYLLRASQGKGDQEIRGERQVQVSRTDVDGLVLDLFPGVKVTGTVSGGLEVPGRARNSRLGCGVQLVPAERDDEQTSSMQTHSDEDGTFTIQGVHPGRYRVRVEVYGSYVASVTSGTHDLTNGQELQIGPGSPEPLEIVLRHDGGTIEGTIDESVKAADGAGVLLAPAAGGEVQREGAYQRKFRFAGLAPGTYQIYLFEDLETVEYRNPEVLRTLKGGESVTVTAGGTAKVTLKAVTQ